MRQRQLGNTGLRVSQLALGTMNWGYSTDAEQAAAQLATFHEAGGTLVETSPTYQQGRGETILGELLETTVPHERLVIATQTETHATSRAALLDSLHGSLRRLRVQHIDLWQLRGWDPSTPPEETLAALHDAVSSGKVRYIGLTHQHSWQLATIASLRRALPNHLPLASAQTEYSLLQRDPEARFLPAAEHHHLAVLAQAPLGRGVLTGKYLDEDPPDSRGADPNLAAYVDHHRTNRAGRIAHAVSTAADGLGTSPAAVALAWVRDRPGVGAPVLGTRTHEQLKTCLNCEDIVLPPAIQAALDDVSDPRAQPHTP
ncbi:aldo/keto reductase [Actinopolyspora erythraea]|uniref:Aldo/keto reductase n=1 Tax=Actinopolyspora erythraea TaxID=414996 RepID=A0A099D687_9ACTN|nr:aldo/keto reductase [Actinopolyspora erythraea]ASU78682.1 aldo/keto reductase [Actinopolyspora erythraea]KGI81436.1 aldo/keto reductase [Actinopolyspora erythraea]